MPSTEATTAQPQETPAQSQETPSNVTPLHAVPPQGSAPGSPRVARGWGIGRFLLWLAVALIAAAVLALVLDDLQHTPDDEQAPARPARRRTSPSRRRPQVDDDDDDDDDDTEEDDDADDDDSHAPRSTRAGSHRPRSRSASAVHVHNYPVGTVPRVPASPPAGGGE